MMFGIALVASLLDVIALGPVRRWLNKQRKRQ